MLFWKKVLLEELLNQVGQCIRKPSSFLPSTKPQKATPVFTQKISSDSPHTLIIGGERKMPHLLAQCCAPHFPSEVVAVMRSG